MLQAKLFQSVQNDDVDMTSEAWVSISDEAKSVVSALLAKIPSQRLSAAEFLDHPWVRFYFMKPLACVFMCIYVYGHFKLCLFGNLCYRSKKAPRHIRI